jgi:hypothetical protein
MSASKKPRVISSMEIAKQLALFVANKPGTFASVCETLARNNINIHAISTTDSTDHSVVRLILSDPDQALRLFEEQGTLVVTNDVLVIETRSRVGNLAKITRCLADNNINLEYAYCATHPDVSQGYIVLRIHNTAKAMKVLNTCKI